MDIRCPKCSKLFRVADEKIAGKGIRFKCSKCAEVITITKDDFEMDVLAREAEATAPVRQAAPPSQPVPPVPPPVLTQPAPAPRQEAREYQPQEYQPPQDQQQEVPPASLSDFDFSEPHAAAATSAQSEEAFGGKDFTFDVEPEQDSAPALGISPEAAAEAEASLGTPSFAEGEPQQATAGMAEADHAQEPAPELAPEPAPVFTPPPRPKTAPDKSAAGDAEFGAAFAAPDGSELGSDSQDAWPPSSLTPSVHERTAPERKSARSRQEEIHPLASGNATGAVAGLGCALPLVVLMTLGFGMMAKILPFFANMPLVHLIASTGAGIISLSVVIGIIIAVAQARAGKKLFFLLNVLIGTLFGAGFGIGESVIQSLMTGTGLHMPLLIANAVTTGLVAFMISILVVLSRRIMVSSKDETFSQSLTGLQKAGLAISLVVALVALYEIGTFAGQVKQATGLTRQKLGEIMTPAGLQIANASGYFEPGTGDLVITGSVQNMTDKPKAGWYLVTEIRDDRENVLASVKMLSGIQLYTSKEYGILAKRGMNIGELQKRLSSLGEGMIPPKGSVPFEVRVMDPPAGSTRFLPALQPFDPSSLAESLKMGTGQQ